MSTKNLARTVIEGGRARFNRWERRYSNAQERAGERLVSARLLTSVELDDVLYPRRAPVSQGFHDKLAPAERWLGSQVGRPWSKVRSEIFERFDTRTTAGRHIVFDHLLKAVRVDDRPTHGRRRFRVDRHGLLRPDERRQRWQWRRLERLPEPRAVLEAWIGGRRVGDRGPRLYWFVRTPSGSFRQHLELCEADAARFRSLPDWFRRKLDPSAPTDTLEAD